MNDNNNPCGLEIPGWRPAAYKLCRMSRERSLVNNPRKDCVSLKILVGC